MGGMPGCPAKPMDLARKAPCKGCLLSKSLWHVLCEVVHDMLCE